MKPTIYLSEYMWQRSIALTKSTFKVYPNPASDWLMIENVQEGFTFSLYNNLGQTITQGTSELANTQLNTAYLTAGIYMLTLTGIRNETIRLVITK